MYKQTKQIVIEIDEQGYVSLDGIGFTGHECHAFLSEIENALGKKISDHNKPSREQSVTRKQINRGVN